MPIGIAGIDSLEAATSELVIQAHTFLGTFPIFWGRYFKAPDSIGEYNATRENAVLSAAGIKLLPIARQTANVAGSADAGSADAQANAEAVLQVFTAAQLALAGQKYFVFLDVEGTATNPSLSLTYFQGWAPALRSHSLEISKGNLELLPCVYARTTDAATWTALLEAAAQGIKCFGAWTAHVPNLIAFAFPRPVRYTMPAVFARAQ